MADLEEPDLLPIYRYLQISPPAIDFNNVDYGLPTPPSTQTSFSTAETQVTDPGPPSPDEILAAEKAAYVNEAGLFILPPSASGEGLLKCAIVLKFEAQCREFEQDMKTSNPVLGLSLSVLSDQLAL